MALFSLKNMGIEPNKWTLVGFEPVDPIGVLEAGFDPSPNVKVQEWNGSDRV